MEVLTVAFSHLIAGSADEQIEHVAAFLGPRLLVCILLLRIYFLRLQRVLSRAQSVLQLQCSSASMEWKKKRESSS